MSSQGFSQKNERMNSFLLVCDVFSFVFWKNPRPETNRFEIIWPLKLYKKILKEGHKINWWSAFVFKVMFWTIFDWNNSVIPSSDVSWGKLENQQKVPLNCVNWRLCKKLLYKYIHFSENEKKHSSRTSKNVFERYGGWNFFMKF